MKLHHSAAKSAAIFCALLFTPFSSALAVAINYNDFVGTTVIYRQVTEDVISIGDSTPLFGAPTITGDSLDFDPVSFSASATGASGIDTTAGNLEFDVEAKPGSVINSLTFTEAGNTTLAGFGTDATFTEVTADLVIDIEEVDGAPFIGGPINHADSMTFSPSGGDYGLLTDGGGGPTFGAQWTGIATIDINQILINNGISFTNGATLVTVTVTNTLIALSEDGTQALISKQDFDGVSVTANIPEPTTACMALLFASSALVFGRKRV